MASLLVAEDLIPDQALSADDPDAFNHEAIACRVAEIIQHAPTPANIALFGAWGSGKSSFFELLRRALHGPGIPPINLVRYDAWKYGGASLKRNFISHAATELGLSDDVKENNEFHRGLYESTRSLDLQFGRFLKGETGKIIRAAVATAVIALFMVVGFAALVAWLTQESAWVTIREWVSPWGGWLATSLAALVAGLKLLDIARVEVEQTAPSADEQFSKTFLKLVKCARKRGKIPDFERLVFFIDELDRCSKGDVVETLTALRTFLDVPHCVFIVVADRDVLEEALTELPQSTPPNEESPYYSTASAFLDKIFQFQIALPPLRVGRLTRFARDLVVDRSGIWGELTADGLEELNEVVYVLIPSHVRSPRRVKVLLNRFATNMRVAQARGLNWKKRASEIAKLTVLQTEFPILADALLHETRLPAYILARQEPSHLPQATAGLIMRFVEAAKDATKPERQTVEEPSTTDKAGNVDEPEAALDHVLSRSARPAIHRAQQRQLIRYLERTAQVQNPGRDLLYLEAAGASAGIEPSTGQMLEDLAPDSPDQALDVARGLTSLDQQLALVFLAEMMEREFGIERANVMRLALGIAVELGEDLGQSGRPLAKALGTFLQEQQLEEDCLTGALHLGLAAEDSDLVESILSDGRLLAQPLRVESVAHHIALLSDKQRAIVAEKVGGFLAASSSVLISPLESLPEEQAAWLLEQVKEPVIAYISERETEDGIEEAAAFIEEILEASKATDAVFSIVWQLLSNEKGSAYHFLKQQSALLSKLSVQKRNSHVLQAFLQASPSDWHIWAPMLSPSEPEWPLQGKRATRVLSRVIQQYLRLSEEEQGVALEIARSTSPLTKSVDEEAADELGKLLQSVLEGHAWWTSSELLESQASLHLLISAMNGGGKALNDILLKLREQDLRRALANGPRLTILGLRGLRQLAGEMPSSVVAGLLELLVALQPAVDPAMNTEFSRSRIVLWALLTPEERTASSEISTNEVIAALGDFSDEGLTALRLWLRTPPTVDQAVAVAATMSASASRKGARIYSEWASDLSSQERTTFLKALWEEGQHSEPWIRKLQPLGVNEVELVEELANEIEAATRSEEREEIIDRLLALAPQEGRAQIRVGKLVMWLLNTGRKVDVQLAVRVAPALGSWHRSKGRIEKAFGVATSKLDVKLTPVQARILKAVGIQPPRRSFAKRAWDVIAGED